MQRIHVLSLSRSQINGNSINEIKKRPHGLCNTHGNAQKRVNRKFRLFQLPPPVDRPFFYRDRWPQNKARRQNDDKWYLIDHDRQRIYRYASVRQFICLVIAHFFPHFLCRIFAVINVFFSFRLIDLGERQRQKQRQREQNRKKGKEMRRIVTLNICVDKSISFKRSGSKCSRRERGPVADCHWASCCVVLSCAALALLSCKHEIPHSAEVHVLQCNYRNAHLCHVSSDSNYYSLWCVLFVPSHFESSTKTHGFAKKFHFFHRTAGRLQLALAKIWNASAKFCRPYIIPCYWNR